MLFFGLLVFLFLIVIRPQDFVGGLEKLPLVSVLMAALIVGYAVSKTPKKFFRTSADRYTSAFFLFMVVSTISLHWLTYTASVILDTIKIAIIFYLIVNLVNNETRIKTMTWTLITFLSIVAGMGILQFYGYDITGVGMLWASDKNIWQIRGAGIFDNPNDLAYSVVMVAPFALGFIFRSRAITTKLISGVLLFIIAYCIYLTGSRGGLLCLVLAGLCWLYLWIGNKWLRRLAAIAAVITIVVAIVFVAGGYRKDQSSMDRIEAWAAGMEMFQSNPLSGVGKGQFGEHHQRDSHSSFIRCAAELGFPGLYLWLGMTYCSIVSLTRLKRFGASPQLEPYVTGYTVFIPSYLFASIFSSRTYDIIFLVVIAMISSFERSLPVTIPDKSTMRRKIRLLNKNIALLTVAVLIILKLFMLQVW